MATTRAKFNLNKTPWYAIAAAIGHWVYMEDKANYADGSGTVEETIPSGQNVEDETDTTLLLDELNRGMLLVLDARERHFIHRIYAEGVSALTVGRDIGVSHTTAAIVHRTALLKLRRYFEQRKIHHW